MTLPEMKSGLFMASVALGLRVVDGILRDVDPDPVEPLPRCAEAVAASKMMTKASRVLD